MPDISMCSTRTCPLRQTCYRFTATPKEYGQSYFTTPPYKDGKCEYYWPTAELRKRSYDEHRKPRGQH